MGKRRRNVGGCYLVQGCGMANMRKNCGYASDIYQIPSAVNGKNEIFTGMNAGCRNLIQGCDFVGICLNFSM